MTPTELSQRIGSLSPQQRALLKERLAAKTPREAAEPAIRRRTATDPRPLSYNQQRLWFLDQLTPATSTYNVPFFCRIKGELSAETLRRAVEEIVARHEVLRTIFVPVKGRPLPVVPQRWEVPFRQEDLRGQPDREQQAQRLLHQEAARPFDLGRDVMLRVLLIRLDERECLFLHTSHHIAWEYWSTSIWYQELSESYGALIEGRRPSLPELPVQYADYALWQRRWLRGPVLQRLEDYWKRQLAGAPAGLALPLDKPRPAVHTTRGAKIPVNLPSDLLQAAKDLSLQSGVTPFMTLLAAFNIFLFGHTGQHDLCIGSPVASRPRVETKGLIGFFANTVVLRTRIANDLTLRDVMKRVRDVTLGAIANQALPFDKLVEAVAPARDLSRMPLFQVNFRLLKTPPLPLTLPGLAVDPPEFIDSGTSKFDLALELVASPSERGYGSTGFWEYCSDLFEEQTVWEMAADYERILRGVLQQPDLRLDAVAAVRDVRERMRGRQMG